MPHLNIEIKAHCADPSRIRAALQKNNADFRGIDRQIDTFFNVPYGRLKLREGNIEHALIHYQRPDRPGPKPSTVTLYKPPPGPASRAALKEALSGALGVLAVVDKEREIYFIGNVKFHLDTVKHLGHFVEIEAIDADGEIGGERLLEQCRDYMALFGIQDQDLVECSYSDLLLRGKCRGEAFPEA
ncbi:MAG: class IV adenylate cyclase [Anaerolineae bacterium]|nr:class IV adenylate cyclase [Anaerolineae bacterium]